MRARSNLHRQNCTDRFLRVRCALRSLLTSAESPRSGKKKAGLVNKDVTLPKDVKTFKVVLLGTQCVGKTSLIERFQTNEFKQYKSTIGGSVPSDKVLVGQNILWFWDTAGQERFKTFTKSYMRDGHCGVLVYDLTDFKSFLELEDYKDLFLEANPQQNFIFTIVGTKLDMVEKNPSRRAVTQEQVRLFASKIGACGCYETSAQTGQFVQEAFESISAHLTNMVAPMQQSTGVQLTDIVDTKSGSCCSGAPKQPTIKENPLVKSPCFINDYLEMQLKEEHTTPYLITSSASLSQLACESSVIGLTADGNLEIREENPPSDLAKRGHILDFLSFKDLEDPDKSVKHIESSWSVTYAVRDSNIYVSTLVGAKIMYYIPRKLNCIGQAPLQFASGSSFMMVVLQNGSLYSWGQGVNGELGHDNKTTTLPFQISKIRNIKSVACGQNHAIALSDSGEVVVWGDNSHHQLGVHTNGKKDIFLLPFKEPITQVACGKKFSLALTESGSVYSWGYGKKGSLGHGDYNDAPRPKLIEGLKKVVQIACGFSHSLALTKDGDVYSWGNGLHGRLGLGDGMCSNKTTPCKVSRLQDVKQIACGGKHSAAISSWLWKHGLYTWGCGVEGQLGHRDSAPQYQPKKVEFFSKTTVVTVSCGGRHTLVLTEDGILYGFGANSHGQLGVSPIENEIYISNCTSPTIVRTVDIGKDQIRNIYCGYNTSCLLTDNNIFLWGNMSYTDVSIRRIDEISLPSKVTQIACGLDYTLALADNRVISWGRGPGTGHKNEETMFPTLVEGLKHEKVLQIATTARCSTALAESGKFYVWGTFGDFKNATPTSFLENISPAKIICSACKILLIDSLGDVYHCDSGEAVCEIEGKMLQRLWSPSIPEGKEASAQKMLEPPVEHLNDSVINFGIIESLEGKAIVDGAAGIAHVLLLTSKGEVYSFGSGFKGQLGLNKRRRAHRPMLVTSLKGRKVTKITCGSYSSCVLTDKGELFQWGTFSSIPTQSPMPSPVVQENPRSPVRSQHTCPAKCEIKNFQPWGLTNKPFTFVIEAKSSVGQPRSCGGDVSLLNNANGDRQKAIVQDNEDGTYSVEFTPKDAVTHIFEIRINKELVPSPYKEVIITTDQAQKLDLSGLQLTTLPSYISHMKSLKTLSLAANKFTRLPSAVTALPNLTTLQINDNCLTSLPGDIGNMKKLKKISFASNPVEKHFGGILDYNDIELLKMYMRHNQKNTMDWRVLDVVFRAWLNKVKQEEISVLLSLSSAQLDEYQRAVRSIVSNIMKLRKDVELSVNKQRLTFDVTESCPVNENIKDYFEMTNSSHSKISYSIYPLIEATSHRFTVLPNTSGELKKGESLKVKVRLKVRFSIENVQNVLVVKVDGYCYLLFVDLPVGLHHIYSASEVNDACTRGEVVFYNPKCVVYRTTFRGAEVAIKKVLAMDNVGIKKEIEVHQKLKHPSIVPFIGCTEYEDPDTNAGFVYIITEYMKHGSLAHVLEKKSPPLGIKDKVSIAVDIAQGIAYLHMHQIIHRDLKPGNITIGENLKAKIMDFGEAKETFGAHRSNSVVGTREYWAPEIYALLQKGSPLSRRAEGYTAKVDSYSLALILCELFTGLQPEGPFKRPEITLKMFQDLCVEPIYDLITLCWSEDPEKRLGMADIVEILQKTHASLTGKRKDSFCIQCDEDVLEIHEIA